MRDVAAEIASDLGGAERLSTLQRAHVQVAATLIAKCEEAQRRLIRGEPIDAERLASDIALLVRVGRQIGLKRVPVQVSEVPSLAAYIAAHDAERREPVEIEAAAQEPAAAATPAASGEDAPAGAAAALGGDARDEGDTFADALAKRASRA